MHRNSQKRYYGEGKTYYIVTKTQDNFPYFREPIFCELFIEELKLCKEKKNFVLFAWSIIHDHVNLLIKTREKYDISQIMFSIKKQFSHDANRVMGYNDPYISKYDLADNNNNPLNNPNEGDQTFGRLQCFQIETVNKFRGQFAQKYAGGKTALPPFKWQKSFHDHVIRGQKDFYHHYRYTVNNPLKHGLPENWPYVSENYENTVDYFEM